MNNKWDKLSSKFNVHKNRDEIDPGAADNILIAWPPIIDLITKHFGNSQIKGLKALDYGCGTGGFSQKLDSLGFDVIGVDTSEGMLDLARKYNNNKIHFLKTEQIPVNEKYNLITGIMVFQFIEKIEETLNQLTQRLNKDGLIVFAVFNPKFVASCLKTHVLFSHFDSESNPKRGIISFGKELDIQTFIRNADDYNKIMNNLGLSKKLEAYPKFTQEYLDKYPINTPIDESEYLILSYC